MFYNREHCPQAEQIWDTYGGVSLTTDRRSSGGQEEDCRVGNSSGQTIGRASCVAIENASIVAVLEESLGKMEALYRLLQHWVEQDIYEFKVEHERQMAQQTQSLQQTLQTRIVDVIIV